MGLFGVNMGFVDVFEVYYLFNLLSGKSPCESGEMKTSFVGDCRHLLLKAMIKNSKPDIAFIFIKK